MLGLLGVDKLLSDIRKNHTNILNININISGKDFTEEFFELEKYITNKNFRVDTLSTNDIKDMVNKMDLTFLFEKYEAKIKFEKEIRTRKLYTYYLKKYNRLYELEKLSRLLDNKFVVTFDFDDCIENLKIPDVIFLLKNSYIQQLKDCIDNEVDYISLDLPKCINNELVNKNKKCIIELVKNSNLTGKDYLFIPFALVKFTDFIYLYNKKNDFIIPSGTTIATTKNTNIKLEKDLRCSFSDIETIIINRENYKNINFNKFEVFGSQTFEDIIVQYK